MQNIDNIGMNRSAINNLSADVDVLRSGVAASLALAGMPVAPGAGWGFAVGTGFFDGESAVAAGLTFRSTSSTYKFSIGNSGGETSASAGGAWNF
jgi:autotransporter adhesin